MTPDEMLARIESAVATLNGADDNLCHALLMLAGSRCITVIPQPDTVTPKPVIMILCGAFERDRKIPKGTLESADNLGTDLLNGKGNVRRYFET